MTDSEHVLEFREVTKKYASASAPTLRSMSLTLRRGEFFSLIGPSGCGKTTTLKLVSGLERPTEGRILLNGRDISALPPHRRPVHTVFQNYALFPHMTVADNIAFGLKQSDSPRRDIPRRVAEAIEMVGLGAARGKKPTELSGGMQQRVALARSLVLSPQILLLDEPLGALDLKLRQQMQVELKRIQRETRVTFLYVTHDQEEAFSMSDRIGFMDAGELVQVDAPARMYRHPRNERVADFVGKSVAVPVIGERDGRIVTDLFELPSAAVRRAAGCDVSTSAVVVLRPELLTLAPAGGSGSTDVRLRGTVVDLVFKGGYTEALVDVGGQQLVVQVTDGALADALRPDDGVDVGFDVADAWLCPRVAMP